MKYIFKLFFVFLLLVSSAFPFQNLQADNHEDTVVYFYHPQCGGCAIVENEGIVAALENEGITVIEYNTGEEDEAKRFLAFNETYNVPDDERSTPLMFAGEKHFHGADTIVDAYESGELQNNASTSLLDVPDEFESLEGLSGLLRVIGSGLLDGINPCAIAMLLMFISMIGFLKDRKTLIFVATSYILGIFITYFTIGIGLFWVMTAFESTLNAFSHILYGLFALLAFILFALTFRDFLVTRKEEYGKVKNQLPSGIKKWNKNIMKRFSHIIENEENPTKRLFFIGVIPFVIGIVIGITEAACTGQIYLMILLSIRTSEPLTGTLYLLVFNIMFILPLIIIAVVAVMTKNVMGVSDFFRKKMPLIKLLTSIFFILMAIYFIFLVFDFSIL
ncbi:MAG: cytochrome c biogenesis CcdA family protein [Bacillota bacterium]